MASQHVQAARGRMIWLTTNRPGIYSSSSVASSPRTFSAPPHSLQASPGDNTCLLRSRWPGSGLRFGFSFGATFSSGAGSIPSAVASAISAFSANNCNWSMLSDLDPKRCRFAPYNWCWSFSIINACAFTSAAKSLVTHRSSAWSSGRLSRAFSMANIYRIAP